MTDAQLATLSRQGSREAFGLLAERWERKLFGFLRRLLGDEDTARDTCQEALLKAYRNIGRLRRPEHFNAWIHQIAVNLCRDRGRSAGDHTLVALDQAVEDSPNEALVSASPSPLDEAERARLSAILQHVLARLPAEQRTAILLREVQGFTSREIGQITGVPATTVRTRIFYGLKALRSMLPGYGVTTAHLEEWK